MFKRLSLKLKISVLVVGVIVSLVSISGIILYFKEDMIRNTDAEIHKAISQEVEQKIKLATDTIAEALGELVVGLDEPSQIAIIAKAIEKFRFESDKSGYYFAYKEHTPVAHPTRKDLIGKSFMRQKMQMAYIMLGICMKPQKHKNNRQNMSIFLLANRFLMVVLAQRRKLAMRQ